MSTWCEWNEVWYGRTGATCCEQKSPTAYLIPFLVDFVEDLDSRRITLKCENELSMKVFQESMSHFMVRETKRLEAVSASKEWVLHGKITD